MATWSVTVTNKGIALQTKQVNGATISFTRVVSGSGSVSIINLKDQTAVSGIVQTLSMESLRILDDNYKITVLLSNAELTKGYNLSQIGFYAMDPDEGEILFAIGQIDTPKAIPTDSDSPGYCLEFAFTFQNSNNATIEITPDMSAYVTMNVVNDVVENAKDEMTISGAATGNQITIDDSADAPLNNITVYGKSIQEGTPTPDSPIDIESVDNPVIYIFGKNLLNDANIPTTSSNHGITCDYEGNGIFHIHGTHTGETQASISFANTLLNIPTTPNQEYTLSAKVLEGSFTDDYHPYLSVISPTSSSKNWLEISLDSNTNVGDVVSFHKKPSDTLQDANKIDRFWIYNYNGNGDAYTIDCRFQVWLEKGSASTDFETCKAQTIAIDNTLCGIPVSSGGNYTDASGQQWICDEIDLARGVYVKRIKEITFNGTESWSYATSGMTRFLLKIDDAYVDNGSSSNKYPMLCTHYIAGSSGDVYTTDKMCAISTGTLWLSDTDYNDVDSWKSYLSTAGVKIIYSLAEPVETRLTDEQLTVLRSLQTFEPTTNVFADDLANMDVEYFKNNGNGKAMAILKNENIELRKLIGDVNTVLEGLIGGA